MKFKIQNLIFFELLRFFSLNLKFSKLIKNAISRRPKGFAQSNLEARFATPETPHNKELKFSIFIKFLFRSFEHWEELCIRVCFGFFFLFSNQNQGPQKIIGLG